MVKKKSQEILRSWESYSPSAVHTVLHVVEVEVTVGNSKVCAGGEKICVGQVIKNYVLGRC